MKHSKEEDYLGVPKGNIFPVKQDKTRADFQISKKGKTRFIVFKWAN